MAALPFLRLLLPCLCTCLLCKRRESCLGAALSRPDQQGRTKLAKASWPPPFLERGLHVAERTGCLGDMSFFPAVRGGTARSAALMDPTLLKKLPGEQRGGCLLPLSSGSSWTRQGGDTLGHTSNLRAPFSWLQSGKQSIRDGPEHSLRVRLETAVPTGVRGNGGAQSPPQRPLPVPRLTPRSRRSRASSPPPRGELPGPWVNAACVCAADILLGHEHDFRVKHLSEALNDKHGPLAGEYCSPAPGQLLTLPSKQSPDGLLCFKNGPGLWPGSHSSLL